MGISAYYNSVQLGRALWGYGLQSEFPQSVVVVVVVVVVIIIFSIIIIIIMYYYFHCYVFTIFKDFFSLFKITKIHIAKHQWPTEYHIHIW